MNWLTIVVVAILVISTITGLKRGMIRMVIGGLALVGAFILTLGFRPPVVQFITEKTSFRQTLVKSIDDQLKGFWKENGEGNNDASNTSALEDLPIPKSLIDMLGKAETLDSYRSKGVSKLSEYVSNYAADMAIQGTATIVLFLVFYILLAMIFHFLDLVARFPGLKEVNHAAGGVIGFIEGIALVWLAFYALTAFSGTDFGSEGIRMISESPVLSFVYKILIKE